MFKKNYYNRSFIWNMIAGMINALQSAIILFVLVRTNGNYFAGIFTIGFSIANLLLNVGHFNVRNYQVTDTNNQFLFADYFSTRCCTFLLMVLFSILYAIGGKLFLGYTFNKTTIILLVCAFKGMDCIEDVFWGDMQKKGKLDKASEYMSIRMGTITLLLCLLLILTKNIYISLIISTVIGYLIMLYFVFKCYNRYICEKIYLNFYNALKIIRECFHLFLNAFLSFYILNASKYAIDRYCSQELQAYYGYISLPLLLMSLLSNFLYQPILENLAYQWNSHNIKSFSKMVKKQILLIFILSFILLVCGNILGIPILSYLYCFNLGVYQKEFNLLLLSGACYAYVSFALIIITIMRKQKYIGWIYGIITIVTYFLADFMVKKYGLLGASLQNLLSMLVCLIFLIVLITVFVLREKNLKL